MSSHPKRRRSRRELDSKRTRTSQHRLDTKAQQICRQVHHRLDLALAELDDPLLHSLWVLEVSATPHSNALQVQLVGDGRFAVNEVLQRLEAAKGLLRSEVAAAIHRKKTPQLTFVVVVERR